jgi:hypothetical protein
MLASSTKPLLKASREQVSIEPTLKWTSSVAQIKMGPMEQRINSSPLPMIVLQRLRGFLLLLLGAEIVGLGAELLLISHWEDWWQRTPLVVLAMGLVVVCSHVICQNGTSIRAFQLVMILLVLSGIVGIWLHYDGRVEFRQELNPSLAGWKLFRAAMTGSTTPPVLAPGVMIQMGCMGLACVYRHPAGAARRKD